MKSRQFVRWIALTAILLGGCAATRQYPAPSILPSTRLAEVAEPTVDESPQYNARNHDATLAPRNILILSGGGMNGAYTAGVLKGWSDAGNRPQFDVVTGISTGALIAPYAFLGSNYNAELERLYTSMRRESIFRPRLLLLDSVASSEPLGRLIAACATTEILAQIAAAHRRGRRLYIGTTNLDTKQLVVWDLGAIAARGTPESQKLFQMVLLASCSIPGLLPPVPIDIEIDGKRFTELHVDGGVMACIFIQPETIGIGPNGEQPPDGNQTTIHVIIAGKLQQTIAPAKRELFSIAGESMNAVLQAKMDGELTKSFMLARYAKANFRLTGIPQDYQLPGDSMSFAPEVMRGLFDEGYREGKSGNTWRSFPPELEKEKLAVTRNDTRFITVRGSPPCNSWRPDKIRIILGDDNPTNAPNGMTTRVTDQPSSPFVQMGQPVERTAGDLQRR